MAEKGKDEISEAADQMQILEKVAEVAKLQLTAEEKKKFAADLNSILESFKVLDRADVEKIEPAFHPIELKNATREDVVEPSLNPDEALANSPQENKEKGYFKGPRVV